MKYEDISMVDLPTPPHSLLAVIRYCSEDETDSTQLASLIRVDPLLSAEMLRIANSPYFGLGGNVTSLNRATVVLGMVGGYFSAAATLRRVENVNEHMSRIIHGDLSERLPVDTEEGNMRDLARNVNAMLDHIQSLRLVHSIPQHH